MRVGLFYCNLHIVIFFFEITEKCCAECGGNMHEPHQESCERKKFQEGSLPDVTKFGRGNLK
jgi:hypothetical protein